MEQNPCYKAKTARRSCSALYTIRKIITVFSHLTLSWACRIQVTRAQLASPFPKYYIFFEEYLFWFFVFHNPLYSAPMTLLDFIGTVFCPKQSYRWESSSLRNCLHSPTTSAIRPTYSAQHSVLIQPPIGLPPDYEIPSSNRKKNMNI